MCSSDLGGGRSAENYAAENRASRARELSAAATTRVTKLRAEHEALAASHAEDQRRRLLRLAGLPDTAAVPA